MRIIAGELGGRMISAPKGLETRPSGERLREALFSILSARIGGARVLDAFAGSGALGFEALSRGAAHCTFVDADRDGVAAISRNVSLLNVGDRALVRHGDVLGMLPEMGAFDLVFLDPPYDAGLVDPALKLIHKYSALRAGGVIICETRKQQTITAPPGLMIYDERVYGMAKVWLLRAGEGM